MVKASVIWLNYNSMKFIDIVLRSLESFLNLDFDNYEVIIVDNASTDGSFEVIKKHVEEHSGNIKIKVIRNDRNLGYAGGMNVGWDARDPDSRYVAFANNDLIATPESLAKLIECLESEREVGACSGLIYFGDGKTIYSAGCLMDEIWLATGLCHKAVKDECPGLDNEHYVTYPDGAYSVVKAEAVRKTMPHGKPFFDETFLFLDDYLLGLALWNRGYKVKYTPHETALHFHGKTIGQLSSFYGYRAHIALSYLVHTRYAFVEKALMLERQIYYLFDKTKLSVIREAITLGKSLLMRLGQLNLYCAPHLKVDFITAISMLLPKPLPKPEYSINKISPHKLSPRAKECK